MSAGYVEVVEARCAHCPSAETMFCAGQIDRTFCTRRGDPDNRQDGAHEHEAPSTLRRAANLATAVAAHVLAGLPTVPETVYTARLAVCRQCPEYLVEADACRLCGCNLGVKARWSEQRCPADRWPE
jgi:Family of unknown function (DUF6171)